MSGSALPLNFTKGALIIQENRLGCDDTTRDKGMYTTVKQIMRRRGVVGDDVDNNDNDGHDDDDGDDDDGGCGG